MDRDAVARNGRRAQALEALAFERDREEALLAQIAQVVLEHDGRRIDDAAFATMSADEVELVRDALGEVDPFGDFDPEPDGFDDADDDDAEGSADDEIARLEGEIELGRTRRRAIERYLQALDGEVTTGQGTTG